MRFCIIQTIKQTYLIIDTEKNTDYTRQENYLINNEYGAIKTIIHESNDVFEIISLLMTLNNEKLIQEINELKRRYL